MTIRAASAGDTDFWHVRFPSEFEPWPDEPGRERWLDYRPVRTAHAWMLLHADQPRPWVVAVNGYRTGEPEMDMWMLNAHRLHRRWGLNVIAVVLPLQGPRAIGMSGSRVIHAGAMNTVFTVAQGAWDIRRVLSWVRGRYEAPATAISGISLGGYMAAMTAALDDDLAAVIAGVPESDLARGTRRQVEPLLPPFYEQWGLSWEPYEQILSVVSPLSLPCLVPAERRYIFAGLLDRWVRPGNVKRSGSIGNVPTCSGIRARTCRTRSSARSFATSTAPPSRRSAHCLPSRVTDRLGGEPLVPRGRADRRRVLSTNATSTARPWPERPVSEANKSARQMASPHKPRAIRRTCEEAGAYCGA